MSRAERDYMAALAPPDGGADAAGRSHANDDLRDEWPDPQPLPLGLPPVAPFDYHLLPESLRPWGEDIVDRMRCPPDYIGVSIMVALAAVVGRQVAIRPKQHDDWTVILNLWAFLIGRPGVLKSPAMEEALKPIKRLVAKAIEEHKGLVAQHKTTSIVTKMKNDAINKAAAKMLLKDPSAIVNVVPDDDDEPPPLHRYMTNDSSLAALAELLRHNPNGLLVHRDELVSLLRSLDQEENADARAFFLTGWNGDSSYTTDRIARGMNLHVEAVCLSLLGSTQPARITEYVTTAVRGGAGDDGMLQRFGLMVWPDIGGEWVNVDRAPNHDALRVAHQTFDYLDRLDYRAIGAHRDTDHGGDAVGVPYLRLAPDALEVFNDWREPLEHELRAGTLHPALESHFAKYRKLVPALALLLHLAGRNQGTVDVESMMRAIRWDAYLRTHARRVYAAATNAAALAARAIIKRIRKGDLPAAFSSRDVWRPGWALLSDRQTVADALVLLVDLGYLREQIKQTAGRPATIYIVNPKLERSGE
jgi:putative DNA primase/helicase